MGWAATGIIRRQGESRIANDNKTRLSELRRMKADRAALLRKIQKVRAEKQRFEEWAKARKAELADRQHKQREELAAAQARDKAKTERVIEQTYQPSLDETTKQAEQLKAKIEKKGFVPAIRRVVRGKKDRAELDELKSSINETKGKIDSQRQRVKDIQKEQTEAVARSQAEEAQKQAQGIDRARQRKRQTSKEDLAKIREELANRKGRGRTLE